MLAFIWKCGSAPRTDDALMPGEELILEAEFERKLSDESFRDLEGQEVLQVFLVVCAQYRTDHLKRFWPPPQTARTFILKRKNVGGEWKRHLPRHKIDVDPAHLGADRVDWVMCAKASPPQAPQTMASAITALRIGIALVRLLHNAVKTVNLVTVTSRRRGVAPQSPGARRRRCDLAMAAMGAIAATALLASELIHVRAGESKQGPASSTLRACPEQGGTSAADQAATNSLTCSSQSPGMAS